MRHITLSLVAALIAVASTATAQSYRAENRVTVTAQSGGLFSVPAATRFGARGAWCAAADYAENVLGASGTSRLYVRIPQTTNSGPVVFGLTPGNTTPVGVQGTTAALRTAGSNLSVDHAIQFCADSRLISSR